MSGNNQFDDKLRRMTTEPVEGLVVRMAAPTMIIMLISALYNMAAFGLNCFLTGLKTHCLD